MSCAIVIPVYKELTDKYEELSFRQCLKVLSNYDVFLVTFEQLDLSCYNRVAEEFGRKLYFSFFPEHYFKGIEGYNSLLKSKQFYSSFEACTAACDHAGLCSLGILSRKRRPQRRQDLYPIYGEP